MGDIGRPRKDPPSDAAPRIEAAAAEGASMLGIAAVVGCSHPILHRWLKEHPELQDAFNRGRESERKVLHNRLFTIATQSGDERTASIAAMFLLKSRHSYREGEQHEQAGPRVTINMPAALSRADFDRMVTVSPPVESIEDA